TIADALFPNPWNGEIGMELAESEQAGAEHSEEMRQAVDEMDQEEAAFADRLRDLMREQSVTQTQLAEKIDVGQPAISMMLNRKCRPQQATVDRIAKALNVPTEQLWPSR
ncbi:MAG: helix-turn-helix transcriptional regulator, partial [Planctomycetales bacterium]